MQNADIKAMLATAALALFTLASPAGAASFPNKPVTILVPFVPGGSSDITARSIAPEVSKLLKQTFVIENKPGANGAIAAQTLQKANPDGYTMMVGSIGTFSINQALYRSLPYNPTEDFTYLTQAVRNPNVLVASPNLGIKDVAGLIARARAQPDKLSYASSGTGSSDHLSAVLFRQKTGTTGVDVPYRGGAAAITDLMGSQVDVSFQNLGAVLTHIKSGKLQALAVTGEKRSADLPDVPTMAEAGIKDMVVYSWQGFAVPKGTPASTVKILSDALRRAMQVPQVKTALQGLGFEVVGNSPEEFATFQRQEVKRWTDVIKQSGIQLE